MKENLVHARTCVYNINYHMVWSTKYRRKVLTKEIEDFMRKTAFDIAADKDFILHLFEVGDGDHVHCFVSAHPKHSVSYLIKMLKGGIARQTLMQYPELKNQFSKGSLWNHSTYIETIGSVSEDNIRRYIEKQTNAY